MTKNKELDWHRVADLDELPEGRVKTVVAATHSMALTHIDGEYTAMENRCPHQGGPLGEGSIENGLLRCPWHGWDYHPTTGLPPGGFDDSVETFDLVNGADTVIDYAVAIARQTRPDADAPDFVRQWITWGAGPRASQNMVLAAKARALLGGRYHVAAEDVAAVAPSVLRHRILTNFAAEAEDITPDDIVAKLLRETQPHPSALDGDRAAGIGS